jgi:hypothetical protein
MFDWDFKLFWNENLLFVLVYFVLCLIQQPKPPMITSNSAVFPSKINEQKFQGTFGITIIYHVHYNVGFSTVNGVKVVIDFDVNVGTYGLCQHHDN